jgi:hypothetical protein
VPAAQQLHVISVIVGALWYWGVTEGFVYIFCRKACNPYPLRLQHESLLGQLNFAHSIFDPFDTYSRHQTSSCYELYHYDKIPESRKPTLGLWQVCIGERLGTLIALQHRRLATYLQSFTEGSLELRIQQAICRHTTRRLPLRNCSANMLQLTPAMAWITLEPANVLLSVTTLLRT